MKVSICCITFNHGEYIKKSLDSFVMQQTNFDFEIVLADDCSTDNSRAIMLEYKQKYPSKINLILQENNVGVMRNFGAALLQCNGEYIALCDGDDYWTDPLKLQKQVDFLEQHPDYNLVCSNVYIKQEPGKKLAIRDHIEGDKTYTIHDLAKRMFIATASAVFRASTMRLPSASSGIEAGDYFLFLQAAKTGKIYYMSKPMAVYRLNPTSSWASKPWAVQLEKSIRQLQLLQQNHDAEVRSILQQQINDMHYGLLITDADDKEQFTRRLAGYMGDSDTGLRSYISDRLREVVKKDAAVQPKRKNVWRSIKNRIRAALK